MREKFEIRESETDSEFVREKEIGRPAWTEQLMGGEVENTGHETKQTRDDAEK